MQPIFFALAAFLSTYLGGLLAVKFKDRLHAIMAFVAGVLLGVVAFDILPEVIEQINTFGFSSTEVMISLVFGFLLFHILEKAFLIHHCHDCSNTDHKHPNIGVLSSLALSAHSFMDGVGIGLGFQVNEGVGILVAVAVISHGFTDGINTVTLMLTNKNSVQKSKWFLLLGSIAPVLGALSTLFFQVSDHFLVLYLGFFAGFLLYIGASDILPEVHSKKSSFGLVALTILGTLLIFSITRLL